MSIMSQPPYNYLLIYVYDAHVDASAPWRTARAAPCARASSAAGGDESDESTTRTTRKRSAMILSADELRDVFRPSEDELEQSRRGVRAQQVMARAAKKQARAKKTG